MKMNVLHFLFSVMLISGCAPLALASDAKIEIKSLGVISTTLITPEGYVLFTTTDLQLVKRLCSSFTDVPDETVVFGCSKWNYEENVTDKHDPKGPCLAIALMGAAPDGENVIEHELRHCREGFWHS